MLLTLAATRDDTLTDAVDLGYLLHKHPDKAQSFDVSVGIAHVAWPEATTQRSEIALVLEIDPIALVRGRGKRDSQSEGFALAQYVNDRPYAAGSMLAVAIARVFKTAMTGRCDSRPHLAAAELQLEICVPSLPALRLRGR